jgi:phosphatidylglycerol:prolipoprotein diacylglycerol transferase
MDYYVHNINPILVNFGILQIRWYGLMYLVGYFVGYLILMRRFKQGLNILNADGNQTLITYIMIGMIIGARIVYVCVYNPKYYLDHPSEIIAVWQGGLSFHGAALGYIVATLMFCRKYKIQFFHVMDNIVFGASIGIIFGRIGNFINGELYGRVTDVPWAVIFPSGGMEPRHPSQLYQALGEGLAVYIVLKFIEIREQKLGYAPVLSKETDSKKKQKLEWKRTGVMACSFLILYGIARFIIEFFRQPDAQLGFFAKYFSMGQILCFLMILAGAYLLRMVIKQPRVQTYTYK